ncbi:DprA-like DNA recombination-mediator protein [Vibrio phage 11895-B1]|uniref:DprA-like DNA recombination-mediator protein n=1 Tax=Vibrio phage 11895-B1 TaxID=754075 RepID=UPI0002C12117|nr:DprA-like DNA recombination-mediator protein [Vibrio phage 11895-B1]AGH32232.1 hypothetical protein VPHG_00169 [Vibrio phage 11895-B1]
MAKQIYYTLIGSRETPDDICDLMTKFATKACSFGYIGRSGGADGADSCLEVGVKDFQSTMNIAPTTGSEFMEVYLPWKDFNGRDSLDSGYYTLPWMDNNLQAEKIASEIHPKWNLDLKVESGEIEKPKNWKPMKQGAKKLHTRNVYQLLGQDLATPSRFVLCWAKPKDKDRKTEHVQGGTGTAVKLGIDNGVEIINLYWEDQRKRVEDWVNK